MVEVYPGEKACYMRNQWGGNSGRRVLLAPCRWEGTASLVCVDQRVAYAAGNGRVDIVRDFGECAGSLEDE